MQKKKTKELDLGAEQYQLAGRLAGWMAGWWRALLAGCPAGWPCVTLAGWLAEKLDRKIGSTNWTFQYLN